MTVAAARPASAQPKPTRQELGRGAKGPDVKKLQERLHAHGFGAQVGRADGDFGAKTASGLRAFQNAKISEYGARIAGAATDRDAIRLSQERTALTSERDRGVAGPQSQRLLNAAPSKAPAAAPPAPTPALPPKRAIEAVGGDPSARAPQETAPSPAVAPKRGLGERSYTVAPGDTMSGIARNHDVGLSDLIRANPQVKDPNRISIGQVLNLPGSPEPAAAPAPAPAPKRAIEAGDPPAPAPAPTAAPKRAIEAGDGPAPAPAPAAAPKRAIEAGDGPAPAAAPKRAIEAGDGPAPAAAPKRAIEAGDGPAPAAAPKRALEAGDGAAPTPAHPPKRALEAADGTVGQLDPALGFDVTQSPKSFEATVNGGMGPGYRVSVNASKATTLGPGGQSMVTLDVSRQRAGGVSVAGDVGLVGLSGGAFAGRQVSYSVTIPEAHYNKVLRGEAPLPDPGNLRTMPDGSSALVRSESFAGSESGGGLGAFDIGGRNGRSEGTAVGIEVHGDNVRVLAGPTSAVQSTTELGIGKSIGSGAAQLGARLSLGQSTTLRNSELAFADISKRDGQTAYNRFLRTGDVPRAGTRGVGEGGVIRQLDLSSAGAVSAEGTLGPLRIGGTLFETGGGSGTRTEVEYNDGRRDVSAFATQNGVGRYLNAGFDASGRQTSSSGGLLLDGVSASGSRNVANAFGKRAGAGPHDAELTFSPAQYRLLRERAFDELASNPQYDAKAIEAVRRGPTADGTYRTSDGVEFDLNVSPLLKALVENKDATGFLSAPGLSFQGPDALAEALATLHARTGAEPLPGQLSLTPDRR